MTNVQVERGYLTQSLGNASHSGEHGLKTVPGLLKLVRDKEAWRERIIVQTGEEFVGFPNFEEYVKANPPKGLGTDMTTLKLLVADDQELLDWIDKETEKAHPHGGDRRSEQVKEKIKGVSHPLDNDANVQYHITEQAKRDRSEKIRRRFYVRG